MNLKILFTLIALVLVFVGYIPYIRDILNRKTTPHAFTFLIWTLSTAVSFFIQVKGGAGFGAAVTCAGVLFQLFIFFLCLRYGTKDITRSDIFFLILALLSLVLWLVVAQPVAAILLAVLVEIFGFIPTVRKSWNAPYSETVFTYWIYVVRHAMAVLALNRFNILTVLFPLTLVFANFFFVVFIYIRRRQISKIQKYAFIDRDGTFVCEPEKPMGVDSRDTFPLASVDEMQFMDGAISNLKLLVEKGYKLVMVTNQTFLGTPKHPRDIFDAVMNRIQGELGAQGIYFEFVMVCPHGPDDECDCRKPKIGGLTQFLDERKGMIDFEHSYMFGDRDTDRQFAGNLGVQFVYIETNKQFILPKNI
ncbi:MAG: HAD-IIIA family hydrolase [bacterium]